MIVWRRLGVRHKHLGVVKGVRRRVSPQRLKNNASTEEVHEDCDEEPPSCSGSKKTSSSASCSKRVKRPRSGKGFLWDNEREGSDGEVSHCALLMLYGLLISFMIPELLDVTTDFGYC